MATRFQISGGWTLPGMGLSLVLKNMSREKL